MASSISYQNGHPVYGLKHYTCDTLEDLNALPVKIQPGSTAYCIANSTEYILGHDAQWHVKNASAGGGSDTPGSIATIKAGGVYDPTKAYEAMTTVSYNGNVYITLKDTPAGTPITDENYYKIFLEGIPDGSDKTFIYAQAEAVDVWTIKHDMNKYPSVTIIGDFDNGRESVLGDIEYVDDNTLTIHFDEPVKGTAYLN